MVPVHAGSEQRLVRKTSIHRFPTTPRHSVIALSGKIMAWNLNNRKFAYILYFVMRMFPNMRGICSVSAILQVQGSAEGTGPCRATAPLCRSFNEAEDELNSVRIIKFFLKLNERLN